ncbi:uncharacterized protein LOC106865663 [Brachypodium distachyon]|uniref:uncharacterized protein LOC106865663 n=1 Tax=Brachypodium distachyon TaxID=15368 RepID=UPI00071DC4F7|nr:uncharacterized protein LOC106865663 [Brachypodium distachyon]|eukprot:XP_014751732.1 uncharacterized protein LOC106865663 [Brachypodium distachyon]
MNATDDEDIPSPLSSTPIDDVVAQDKPNEVRLGPITRARAKLLEQQQVEKKVHEAINMAQATQGHNVRAPMGFGHGGGRGDGGRGHGRADEGRGNGHAGAFPMGHARHEFDHDDGQHAHRDDDGLGKPKFSIPKFEGSTDVEEYLIWELKIEKLWRLHEYTEDRKIKLASSEFDGYALRWWDNIVRTRQEEGDPPIITWRTMKEVMRERFIPRNYMRSLYDKLQNLRQGTMSVDDYFQEMELIMQRARVHEQPEQTMQRFLSGLTYNIKRIVRHHQYCDMTELLHHAREAKLQLAEDAKFAARGRFTPRPSGGPPPPSPSSGVHGTSSRKPESAVTNAKKLAQPAASAVGSSMSTARNRDMNCHTCGGKGHFKHDCPNKKVMLVNEDLEYETGDDTDPESEPLEDEDAYDEGAVDAYATHFPTIVCSQRVLNVTPSPENQRCNLFQTKAIVGPSKACKVIIDGGSCRNLASKEPCAKLKLKYLPHPNPYYIQWLSDSGEMKISHLVHVEFQIGPYKDTVECDVVPMTVCHLLLGRPWQFDRNVCHDGRANTYHLHWRGKDVPLRALTLLHIVNESRQKVEVNCENERED